MPYINRVIKKGIPYLYLVKDARIDGKKVHLFQKYLGPESRIKDIEISAILKDHSKEVECETLEFGISAALWQIAEDIDIVNIIDGIAGKSRDQGLSLGEYLTIAAINRCVKPCSKSRLERWFSRDWISTKYDRVDPAVLNAQTYWNHFQHLNKEKIKKIERAIVQAVVTKYNLGVETVLYDTTNFFTYSRGGRGWQAGKGSLLLMFGKSKENRNGNRLVAVWLLCDRDTGIPIMHETYPGNRQDAGVFKGSSDVNDEDESENNNEEKTDEKNDGTRQSSVPMLVVQRLQAIGCDPKRVTMVFDNGNLSPEGVAALEETGLGFIASRRPSTHKDLLCHPLDQFTETTLSVTGKKIKYFRTIRAIYGKEWTVYVTFDQSKHDKDVLKFGIHVDSKITRIKEYFSKDRLEFTLGEKRKGQGDKWRDRSEVERKIKSMIGPRPFKDVIVAKVEGPDNIPVDTGGQFKVIVSVDEKARSEQEATLGRAVIFTNRVDWSPEAVIWGHREQYVVEHSFHRMKCHDSIAIRPMYHHSDPCIHGHVFTCVLGHLLLSILRLTASRKKCPASYGVILDALRDIKVTKIFTSPKNAVLKVNRTRDFAARLYSVLGLNRLVTF